MPLSTNTLLRLSSKSHPNIRFATNATMPSLLLLALLLSTSISACDSRHLSSHDKDFSRASHHDSSKDAAVVKLDDKTSAPLMQASSEEEIQSSATMGRSKGLEAPMKDVEAKRDAASGSEVLMTSSHVGLLRTRPEVRSGSRVRSSLEYESNEATIGHSGSTRAAADLLAMDYPKPQRGPSIHNK